MTTSCAGCSRAYLLLIQRTTARRRAEPLVHVSSMGAPERRAGGCEALSPPVELVRRPRPAGAARYLLGWRKSGGNSSERRPSAGTHSSRRRGDNVTSSVHSSPPRPNIKNRKRPKKYGEKCVFLRVSSWRRDHLCGDRQLA